MAIKMFIREECTNHQEFADNLSDEINAWLSDHSNIFVNFVDFRLAGNTEDNGKWYSIISVKVDYSKSRIKAKKQKGGGAQLKGVRVKIFLDENNMEHQKLADEMSERVNVFIDDNPRRDVHFVDMRIASMAVPSSGGWTALGLLVQYSDGTRRS